jgi:hypothetical protein
MSRGEVVLVRMIPVLSWPLVILRLRCDPCLDHATFSHDELERQKPLSPLPSSPVLEQSTFFHFGI